MIEQVKLKDLENTYLMLTETNQFFILGLVEGLKHAQGNTNSKSLAKKELKNYKNHNIFDIC
ncbi:MAG: hypothetical protein FWB95_08920 [Treponema sp.]|nr:hypothetical protein [Treponema sp.]